MTPSQSNEPITIDDVRAGFRELATEVDTGIGTVREGRTVMIVVGGAALVLFAFWLGSRRGRRTQTIVEIRRV